MSLLSALSSRLIVTHIATAIYHDLTILFSPSAYFDYEYAYLSGAGEQKGMAGRVTWGSCWDSIGSRECCKICQPAVSLSLCHLI